MEATDAAEEAPAVISASVDTLEIDNRDRENSLRNTEEENAASMVLNNNQIVHMFGLWMEVFHPRRVNWTEIKTPHLFDLLQRNHPHIRPLMHFCVEVERLLTLRYPLKHLPPAHQCPSFHRHCFPARPVLFP